MKSLEDAWEWYRSVREQLEHHRRFGEKFWSDPAIQGPVSKDNSLRFLTADEIAGATRLGLEPLDDIAVFVLFSVFEAE